MVGLLGSTVSWYCLSDTSSMRAPRRLIEPPTAGVSMVTRGERATAASRDSAMVAAGAAFGTDPGTVAAAPPAWLGVAGGLGAVGLTCVDCWAAFWAARRCRSA